MQNGTSTDEQANAAPKLRWLEVRWTSLRKAKLDPRSTMPNAASESGTNRVSVIDWNARARTAPRGRDQPRGWLHTSPIAFAHAGTAPGPPANRSQKPAPKSAPQKSE
jgi:hypothetical protein